MVLLSSWSGFLTYVVGISEDEINRSGMEGSIVR